MPHDNAPRGFDRELGPGGLESRTTPVARAEVRAEGDDDELLLVGYGATFDEPFRIGGFFSEWDEEVAAGAFTDAIKAGADVRSMRNHDTSFLLGRTTNGTLRLSEDDHGLKYEVDINPDDPAAMGTYAQVKRGDIDGSSIWFRVEEQKWQYPNDDNGLEVPKRTILKVNPLYETGPVVFPANTSADVSARSAGPLVDAVLRSAGVTEDLERAELAQRLLSDPAAAEAELRGLFARLPDLREAVCACGDEGRLADGDDGDAEIERRHRVARGMAARYGLQLTNQE